ncbi:11028_t:CDS:2, partial [Ambispora leptoticha]
MSTTNEFQQQEKQIRDNTSSSHHSPVAISTKNFLLLPTRLLSSAIKLFSQEYKTNLINSNNNNDHLILDEDSRSELSSLSPSECSTPITEDLDNWPEVKLFDNEYHNELLNEYLKAHVEKSLLIGEKQEKKVISTSPTPNSRKEQKNKHTLYFDNLSDLLADDFEEDGDKDIKFLDNPFYEYDELFSPPFNHEENDQYSSEEDEENYKIEDNRYNEE